MRFFVGLGRFSNPRPARIYMRDHGSVRVFGPFWFGRVSAHWVEMLKRHGLFVASVAV